MLEAPWRVFRAFFVSARLINPAGEPVRLDEEKEEEVETLPLMEAQAPLDLPLMSK